MSQRGILYTISAPSGAGKTSLVKALLEQDLQTQVSISHTTRPQRPNEEEGKDYYFVNSDQFLSMLGEGEFLEHAQVFKNHYGTSRSWVEQALRQQKDVILEIDWQGAKQVKNLLPETQGIFILPPSKEALEQRLRGRGQDDEAVIQNRMQAAVNEMSHFSEAQWLIVNDDFDQALADLKSIIHSQRLKIAAQQQNHASLLNDLLSL